MGVKTPILLFSAERNFRHILERRYPWTWAASSTDARRRLDGEVEDISCR